ncbi:MAG: hypothetical protein PHH11_14305 [Methylomonas sp.]|nr:hypothetical protein [Methylomonas sp.]
MRSILKAFRDLQLIDINRMGLERVLDNGGFNHVIENAKEAFD